MMNLRTTLALCMAAGTPMTAAAQEVIFVHYSWLEVQAGTTSAATGPLAGNSIVDPGEGARIRVGVTSLINGANAVGQTTTYTIPAPGGIGTVKGIGSVVYDLVGDENQPSAFGSWFPWALGPSTPPFAFGNSPGGIPQAGGATLHGIGGAQFMTPGSTASPINNNVQIYRNSWTPNSYSPRTVNFLARPSIFVPAGEHSTTLFSYGIGTGIHTSGEPFNYDLYYSKYIGADFGQGLNIPIAPAPASLALCAAVLIPSLRRQRRERPR